MGDDGSNSERPTEQAPRLIGLGRALAMIMHEQRNLLTPLPAESTLARRSGDTARKDRALAEVHDRVSRLLELSDLILEMASDGPAPTDDEHETDLAETAAQVAGLAGLRVGRGRGCLLVDVPRGTSVRLHPVALRHVLLNLVLNAVEASGEARLAAIEVSAHDERTGLVVEVRDRGRGPGGASAGRARGLGLSVVEGLLRAPVRLMSRDGGGAVARFHVTTAGVRAPGAAA